MTKKEKKRDKYLTRKYVWSLEGYNAQLLKQKGRCAICRRLPKNLPLAVDHWHKLAKLKVRSFKKGKYWRARVDCIGIRTKHKVRGKAIKAAKRKLLALSRRGLLCWHCNTGLRKWLDNPNDLMRAAKYLMQYQSKYEGMF